MSKHRRRLFLLVASLMFLTALTDVVSLGAIFPFITVLTKPETVFYMVNFQFAFQLLGITRAEQLALPLTVLFIGASLLACVFRLVVSWASIRLTHATGHELGTKVYQTTLYQPYQIHANRNSSEVISGVIKVNSAASILFQLLTLINSVLISSAVLVTLMYIDPVITSLTVLGFGSCYGALVLITKGRLAKNSRRIAIESTRVIKVIQEGLGGIREVLLDGHQPYYVAAFRRADWANRYAIGMTAYLATAPRYAIEGLGMILIAVLAYCLSMQSGGLGQALPLLGAMGLGAQRLLPAMQQIYAAWAAIHGAQGDLKDALDLIEQPLDQKAVIAPQNPLPFKKEIQFEHVYFRYDENGTWVIKDFNLKIPRGSRIGFVGGTGCGKSTTLDLFMGLLLPSSGHIRVDGETLDDSSIKAWQRIIAHVPQNIFLADTTIAANIAFGESPETINMERVRLAAQRSQIASFIESGPEGYNAMVGERGVRLSGGQCQRMGIARALYKDASVLVFDEATSALDSDTEREVMEAIEGLGNDLTILIIAHRLSTVNFCDTIVQLDQGRIVAQGTYGEIIDNARPFQSA